MKKFLVFILSFVLGFACLYGCGKDVTRPKEDSFSMFTPITLDPSKHLYVIDTSKFTTNYNEYKIVAEAIQGLVARAGKSCVYVTEGEGTDSQFWLDDLAANYGFTREMVRSIDDLVLRFKDYITDSGYVLYNLSATNDEDGTNVATSACAATGYLPVGSGIGAKAAEWGLTLKEDLTVPDEETGEMKDQEWAFAEYKDRLSNKMLLHQMPTNIELRDYMIATRTFAFYSRLSSDPEYLRDVFTWAVDNAPVMGWIEHDENSYITMLCMYKKTCIGTDYSRNLSILAGVKPDEPIRQKPQKVKTGEQGKHYVALQFSDGDAINLWGNGIYRMPEYYGSKVRGEFPFTWGVSANAAELNPTILKWAYDNATENDDFQAGVCGNGYVQLDIYEDVSGYASMVNPALKRSGINYTTLYTLTPQTDQQYMDIIKPFADQPNFKGGLFMVGAYYKEGAGKLFWSNDKPVLAFRESLWDLGDNPVTAVAQRINDRPTDLTSIDSYTLINVHMWSQTLETVKKFIGMLDENVEVVTVNNMMQLIIDNVPHVNATPKE